MALVNRFAENEDFFDVNPELKYIQEFTEFKKSYKNYSKVLWFVAYFCDDESKYKNFTKQGRFTALKEILPKDFLPENDKRLSNLIDVYYQSSETTLKRMLRYWKEKLDEKSEFFKRTPYNQDTWEMLDKMQAGFVQAYKQYEQIMKELSKDEGSNMGGSQDSLSDAGMI